MADQPAFLTASDFPNANAAADHALSVAMVAHDVALVVSLALTTEAGTLGITGQEAIRTVALYGREKAKEARDAIDLAGGMIRREGRHG